MRVVYSDRFKPHTKRVVELLQLISDGRDKLQSLKGKSRLNSNNLIDYLAFSSLTGLIKGRDESRSRGFPKRQLPNFEELVRHPRTTYKLTALGQDLLRTYQTWQSVLDSPNQYSDSAVTQARQDLESAFSSVREHPDLIGDRLAPRGFSMSVLHPEF